MFSSRRNKYQLLSDEELVLAYKSDEKNSILEIIYERYGHLIMGTCMKYLKNVMDSEDVLMQIFEQLPTKLKQHQIQHFKSWLYMVTKNECLMILRKKKGSDDLPFDLTEEEEIDHSVKEVKIELATLHLAKLKEEQRICLELFYLKDQSYQQISDQLQINIKQVKSAIQNGKRNLKMKLEEHHEFKTNE